jgi:hypothetical protein
MAFPQCDSKKIPKRDRDDKTDRLVPDQPNVPKPESEKQNAQFLDRERGFDVSLDSLRRSKK